MPRVDLTIAGRRHSVQCDPGEEARLGRLAAEVDAKAAGVATASPQLGEASLLLLASLLIADELLDAREALAARPADGERGPAEEAALACVARVAARLEQLAEDLEAP